jgi:recombination protein RecR
VGPRTAERLALHLLRQPTIPVQQLAKNISDLHGSVKICQSCFNLAESEACSICSSQVRRRNVLCIVEDALDVEAIEKTGAFDGLYHVLGGVLSPVDGIGPEKLSLEKLWQRLVEGNVNEIIVALDHKLESDATTRHIINELQQREIQVEVSRLARGLPTGGDIEFADRQTLSAAFEGRKVI